MNSLSNIAGPWAKTQRKTQRTATPPAAYLSESTTSSVLGSSSATETSIESCEPVPLPADMVFVSVREVVARVETTPPDIDAVTVSGVGPAQFAAIDAALEAAGRKCRLFFFHETKCLVITVPTKAHERLHGGIYARIDNLISQMGLEDQWAVDAATRHPEHGTSGGGSGGSGGSQGEGDSSGGPRERWRRGRWPTLVIEAGYSQSIRSLHQKMRFWFAASHHDVKIVTLAKAFPNDADGRQKRILLEQWAEEHVAAAAASNNLNVVTRRAAAAAAAATPRLEPVCVQTINIVWARPDLAYAEADEAEQYSPNNFVATRGPLRLGFERLFLRPPNRPAEDDLVLPDEKLQKWAVKVWAGGE